MSDPTTDRGGLDIRAILRTLPHRYPFLLVDRILEIDGCSALLAILMVPMHLVDELASNAQELGDAGGRAA